ncbi:VOC family protein [Thiothrix lacustris]|uniref:VOC family protein n=1 Tax=Thiothrix lacustris TaxID=525917 RepID=UPI0027E3B905|nr:VOC family protein [Thiothrix lacustris]WMP19471.1 hypothetical protein RCS87_19470 [Thiothrix lacustris]
MHLNLLVLRCRDIEATRTFYTQLGLTFTREQHGSGPVHYSTYLGGLLLELYPTNGEPDNVKLGFSVPPTLLAQFNTHTQDPSQGCRDPDGRFVALSADE